MRVPGSTRRRPGWTRAPNTGAHVRTPLSRQVAASATLFGPEDGDRATRWRAGARSSGKSISIGPRRSRRTRDQQPDNQRHDCDDEGEAERQSRRAAVAGRAVRGGLLCGTCFHAATSRLARVCYSDVVNDGPHPECEADRSRHAPCQRALCNKRLPAVNKSVSERQRCHSEQGGMYE